MNSKMQKNYSKDIRTVMMSAFENNWMKPILPCHQFNSKIKLKPSDRKILDVTIFPQLEELVFRTETKVTIVRFSSSLIANLLKVYRTYGEHHGIELSVRGNHPKIQSKGMPVISNFIVNISLILNLKKMLLRLIKINRFIIWVVD